MVRIPFENMMVRQDSELFEHLSKGPEEMAGGGKSGDPQREFKLSRRWSGRRQKENVGSGSSSTGQRGPRGEGAVFGDPEVQPEEQRIKTAVEKLTHHRGGVIADGSVVGLPFMSLLGLGVLCAVFGRPGDF